MPIESSQDTLQVGSSEFFSKNVVLIVEKRVIPSEKRPVIAVPETSSFDRSEA